MAYIGICEFLWYHGCEHSVVTYVGEEDEKFKHVLPFFLNICFLHISLFYYYFSWCFARDILEWVLHIIVQEKNSPQCKH